MPDIPLLPDDLSWVLAHLPPKIAEAIEEHGIENLDNLEQELKFGRLDYIKGLGLVLREKMQGLIERAKELYSAN